MDDTETTTEQRVPIPPNFPPVLYVPCAEHVTKIADARPVMKRTREGKLALFVYSALDRLHDGCGNEHPWVLLSVDALEPLQDAQGFDLILLDVIIPKEYRGV